MKILQIFNSENLKKNLKNIGNRFPVTIAIILSIAILFFLQLHYNSDFTDVLNDNMIIAILSLIMTFVFSIGVYLSTENSDFSKIKRNLYQIIPVIFGIGFYFTFSSDIDNFENIIFFLLTLSGIISYLFFAPYLKNIKERQSVYYTYFYNISALILISFILGGVLFALGAIGIGAVDALFDLDIDEENTYGNWAILSLSVITPLFTLTQVPEKTQFRKNKFNENIFFSFLTKFVAIPFITIYFLILYAYSIKVLSNFSDWPKGEVSWLVIGFSIFGYITYIFSYIFEEKNKFIKLFRKAFPYIVVPQIFMLFYAIYLRINQYDITINRYFVVVFGLWLLVISLYYVFSRKKYLSVIPAILTLFTIIISVGPWSVYSLPETRQLDRLETNLKKAGIIEVQEEMYKYTIAQKIIPLKNYSDISEDLSKNIYSGIDYLCDFNNCEKIKNLFPEIYQDILEKDEIQWEENILTSIENIKRDIELNEINGQIINNYSLERLEDLESSKYNEPSKWTIIQKITETIKVKRYFDKYSVSEINIYSSYDNLFPLNINGYKELIRVESNRKKSNKKHIQINIYDKNMEVYENGEITKIVDLKDVFQEIIKRYNVKGLNTNWSQEDLTFEIDDNYKIIFQTITFPRNYEDLEKKEDFYYYNMYGIVLVK